MSRALDKLVREDLALYYKGEEEKIGGLLSYLSDRLFIVSLLETAKFGGYPYNWLSKEQRNFLDNDGEKWLASYVGVVYPVYSRSDDYGELVLSYLASEIDKVRNSLDFKEFNEINSVSVDRFLRFKIRPESYRNFNYVVLPVFTLYGLKHGFFKDVTDLDRKMLERVSVTFLNRFFSEFLKKESDRLEAAGVNVSFLKDIERVFMRAGYNYFVGRVISLRKKLVKKNVSVKEKDKSSDRDEVLDLVVDALRLIKKVYYPYYSKVFKEKTGLELNKVVFKIRKKYISKEEYNDLLADIQKIKEIKEIKTAGELLEKAVLKKGVKERGLKQVNVSDLKLTEEEEKRVDRVVKYLSKELLDLDALSEEDLSRFKKALFKLIDLANKKDIGKYASIRMYF